MQGRSAGAPAHLPSRTALGRGDDAKMGEGHAFRTLWTHIEQNNPNMDVTGAHGRLFAHPVRVSMSLATPAMLARSTKLRDR